MADRWNWNVPDFNPRKSMEETRPVSLARNPSVFTAAQVSRSELSQISRKFQNLKDQLKHVKEEYLELRQEASDLREYSNAKLDRVTRYLGVLAERTHKLDQAAVESEARIVRLVSEKKRLFNELLTANGNIKVYCRTRPLFEDEGASVVEFPDEYTIRVCTGDDSHTNTRKDYEFDRVYGPHVGQGEFFSDVKPFMQSALDGYNVSIFAYGQSYSGKTHTMEGSSNERGLYLRCFEELFDLSNADITSTSRYNFHITAFELYNDKVSDLLIKVGHSSTKVRIGRPDSGVELVQEKVNNPLEFLEVLKAALHGRGTDSVKANSSHLVITIYIHHSNWLTNASLYSKVFLVDLPGSECLLVEHAVANHVKDFLHVSKSLSALGDVLHALTSQKESVPYENSMLTGLLSDSIGGSAKTLLIINVCPNLSNLSDTISTLNFAARTRIAELSLGNRDTIKKWRDVANDARKELYEREKEICDLKKDVAGLNVALKEANDQCILLFNEVQRADSKSENAALVNKLKTEKDQSILLKNQVAQLLQVEQEQKIQIEYRDSTIKSLKAKLKEIELQLHEVHQSSDTRSAIGSDSSIGLVPAQSSIESTADSSKVTQKLEEELAKRDELIQRLHEENEKLLERLTGRASVGGSQQVYSPLKKSFNLPGDVNSESIKGQSVDALPPPASLDKSDQTGTLVKSGPEKGKITPAGEYLTSALVEFDPDQFESFAAIADGANKLLMLVLAAVIKAGAAREHEILAEIRDAVFSFIRKMEQQRVMDTMLVSRVRILYIRSLLARSPELQSMKVSSVERFLEKANAGRSRSSSRGSSPGRSPHYYDSNPRNAIIDEHIHGFKVNIKQDKKSKFSSIVLKLRGIDEETWKQHVTGGKLREITEEAKAFAVGNKALAALFVHTPAGELQRQIRTWLAENFDFLSVTGSDATGGTTGQLELLSTAIMDGWMAGLGAAQLPSTDALGQLLSDYTKRVYTSQLQHLKDIGGTLATEEAEDVAHVTKLRSALESVDHKRRKILQQMRSDSALLSKEEGGSPIRNPSTATEDARLASLISLDGILKQVKETIKQSSASSLTKFRKKALLASLDELLERMPSLLDIDHPCSQKQILDARKLIESIPEDESFTNETSARPLRLPDMVASTETDVTQWNVLQFNTGSSSPFIIKCGANSNSELVIKADARAQDPKGGEIIRVVPRPSILSNMSIEEIKTVFEQLPEAISLLALARTADGTRARYSRLYRTLAAKVPSLKALVDELEK